jgi:ArsR family transcriptional regulator
MNRTTQPNLARTARWFHALADETRLRIVERLCSGEQCVCDLTDSLQTGQSRLSFHLKTLKDAGILNDRRDGRWVYYSLNAEVLGGMIETIRDLKDAKRQGLVSTICD